MHSYFGRCHCGAVTFRFRAPEITRAMSCDCSICRRKGGLLTDHTIPPEDIEIADPGQALRTYQFGTEVAKHHFCSRCGIHCFVETRLNPGQYRVNLGCVDQLDLPSLDVEHYDGQSL